MYGRGNWGGFGRTSSVGRGKGQPGSAGYWGYSLTGQTTQKGPNGMSTTYNVFTRNNTGGNLGNTGGNSNASAPAPSESGPATPPATPPGNNDNNKGLDRLGRSGLEIPKTRESKARRRASTRGRRARGTRRSLRISQSIASQGSRSGVNTGD